MKNPTIVFAKVAIAAAVTVPLTACDSIHINLPQDGVTVDISQQDAGPTRTDAPENPLPEATGQPNGQQPNPPSTQRPRSPEPDKDQPAGNPLNVIDVGNRSAYFSDPVTGATCTIKKSQVYCGTDSLEGYDVGRTSIDVCGEDGKDFDVSDLVIAEGKVWYSCVNEPLWTMFAEGTEDDYESIVDWVLADKTGKHKAPANGGGDLGAPTLLTNTKLVAGEHSCTALASGLSCENSSTGASFKLTNQELTTTKEADNYVLPG